MVPSMIVTASAEAGPQTTLVDPVYLLIQCALAAYIIYLGQKAFATYDRSELFTGGLVRSWFLSILTLGMGLRVCCNLAIILLPRKKPFLLSWLHFIPGLVLLSAYSLLLVFFVTVRKDSEGALLPGHPADFTTIDRARDHTSYLRLGYIAPSLVAGNLLIYFIFALVGSLAHLRHAHREFRVAGSIFLGVLHCAVALAWFYNAGILSWLMIKRSKNSASLIRLDDPLIHDCCWSINATPTTNPTSHSSENKELSLRSEALYDDEGYYLDSFGRMSQELRTLKRRICLIAFLCPLLFLLGGIIEMYKGVRWNSVFDSSSMDFYTKCSLVNCVIYMTEILPAFICLMTFSPASSEQMSSLIGEEKYVLGLSP